MRKDVRSDLGQLSHSCMKFEQLPHELEGWSQAPRSRRYGQVATKKGITHSRKIFTCQGHSRPVTECPGLMVKRGARTDDNYFAKGHVDSSGSVNANAPISVINKTLSAEGIDQSRTLLP
jgi:hypothetical protein